MAIYIKGVELPTNCLTCPFTEKDDRMGTICYFTNIVALNIGRQKDCPLVYIPEPHGRLIDADDVMNVLDAYKNAVTLGDETQFFREVVDCVKMVINGTSPTVIERSE